MTESDSESVSLHGFTPEEVLRALLAVKANAAAAEAPQDDDS